MHPTVKGYKQLQPRTETCISQNLGKEAKILKNEQLEATKKTNTQLKTTQFLSWWWFGGIFNLKITQLKKEHLPSMFHPPPFFGFREVSRHFGTILRWQYGSELSQRCLGHACGAQNGTQELEWKAELAGKMTFLGELGVVPKVF